MGSNGARGGNGGKVDLYLEQDDVYLLMRVEGCHPQETLANPRTAGGIGGMAGRHGKGGIGGRGGRGGSSYSWTTTSYHTSHETKTHYHSNPGGRQGPNGSGGYTPTRILHNGEDGTHGKFTIKVSQGNGAIFKYESRYNLRFTSFSSERLSEMIAPRTFEFGENVMVSHLKVVNTGGMPSPNQRVMLSFGPTSGLDCDKSGRLFLAAHTNVRPGDNGLAEEGHMEFSCPYPSSVTSSAGDEVARRPSNVPDFDPIREEARICFMAYQLGHENNATDVAQISDFQARYLDFQEQDTVVYKAYPIENPYGIQGFRSLAPMETSILEFPIRSTTHQSLGEDSATGRVLVVQIYYADNQRYEIPIENICVRAENGRTVDVNPAMSLVGKGYRYQIRNLPAGRDFVVRVSFKLNDKNIEVSEKAGLQFDMYLQKIPQLQHTGETEETTRKQLVQRRLFVASCQPRFSSHKQERDVLLVTTTSTTSHQVRAWKALLSRLGLNMQHYSLSRYGHLNPQQEVEGETFGKALEKKLVILLNDEFVPNPNAAGHERHFKCRPSKLFKSTLDHPESARFLFVGGNLNSTSNSDMEHLSPRFSVYHTRQVPHSKYSNMKEGVAALRTRVAHERANGFVASGDQCREGPRTFEVCLKAKMLLTPSSKRIARTANIRAKRLERVLRAQDPLRPYNVTVMPQSTSTQDRKGPFQPRQMGRLLVSVGPPRFQNTLAVVEESGKGQLAAPKAIETASMAYAVFYDSSLDTKLHHYCRCLSAASPQDTANEELLTVVKDCLVGDFVAELSDYHHGRFNVVAEKTHRTTSSDAGDSKKAGTSGTATKEADGPSIWDRSPTLKGLRRCEALNTILLGSKRQTERHGKNNETGHLTELVTRHLSLLMGALESVAWTKDLRPWWNPLSRKHRERRQMIEVLRALKDHWEDVLDDDMVEEQHKCLDIQAKELLQERKDTKYIMLGIRGRWRAALATLHSPWNKTTYPQDDCFRGASLRVRREWELCRGTNDKSNRGAGVVSNDHSNRSSKICVSPKVKKFVPASVTPMQRSLAQKASRRDQDYRQSIQAAMEAEYELYVRQEDE